MSSQPCKKKYKETVFTKLYRKKVTKQVLKDNDKSIRPVQSMDTTNLAPCKTKEQTKPFRRTARKGATYVPPLLIP